MPDTLAEKPARAHCDHGLNDVVTIPPRITCRLKKTMLARFLVVLQEKPSDARGDRDADEKPRDVPLADAGKDDHATPDTSENRRTSHIGLCEHHDNNNHGEHQ